jgi:5-methylthioribose kinase
MYGKENFTLNKSEMRETEIENESFLRLVSGYRTTLTDCLRNAINYKCVLSKKESNTKKQQSQMKNELFKTSNPELFDISKNLVFAPDGCLTP